MKRYKLWTEDDPYEGPPSEYVNRSEALDWFLSLLVDKLPLLYADVINNRERARLRAIIEAERNKV